MITSNIDINKTIFKYYISLNEILMKSLVTSLIDLCLKIKLKMNVLILSRLPVNQCWFIGK